MLLMRFGGNLPVDDDKRRTGDPCHNRKKMPQLGLDIPLVMSDSNANIKALCGETEADQKRELSPMTGFTKARPHRQ